MEPEPFVGLTDLLASQSCDWRDVLDFVVLVRDLGQSMTPRKGLGERLKGKAIVVGAPEGPPVWSPLNWRRPTTVC